MIKVLDNSTIEWILQGIKRWAKEIFVHDVTYSEGKLWKWKWSFNKPYKTEIVSAGQIVSDGGGGGGGVEHGLPSGGNTGQVLAKHSDTDYDTEWINQLDTSGKADKVQNAVSGNFAGLDSTGNLTDSGYSPSDLASQKVLICNFNGSTCDKTPQEIDDARAAGKVVVCKYNDVVYYLTNSSSTACRFRIILNQDSLMSFSYIKCLNGVWSIGQESWSSKANKVANATSGHLAGLDSNGYLTDSGYSPSDFQVPSDVPRVIIPSIDGTYVQMTSDEIAGLRIGDIIRHCDENYNGNLYLYRDFYVSRIIENSIIEAVYVDIAEIIRLRFSKNSSNVWYYDRSWTVTFSQFARKVTNPTTGNFASLDSNGDLADSGYAASDFLTSQDISGKEDISNKVISLSSSSTDTEYPSAKCVYDLIGDIETLLAAI